MLKHLDLFSGIGGFSLGLERTGGFETVAFCEIDPFCQKVLKKHWPDVQIYEDVRTLEYDGPIDLISGGYPCQPFSLAGKRKGTEDDRHLWPAMFDLIKKHRPTWVIGENVPGHIHVGLDDVLVDLESEGYGCRTFVIPACAVDAPHRRDRLWIMAHRNSKSGTFRGDDKTNEEKSFGRGGHERGGGINDQRKPRTSQNGEDDVSNNDGGRQSRSCAGSEEYDAALCGKDVSNINKFNDDGSRYGTSEVRGERSETPKIFGSKNVAHGQCPGLEEHTGNGTRRHKSRRQQEEQDRPISKGCLCERRCEWLPEPDVGRVAHGIPRRMDRLKSLGNAVVPQIVTVIGYAILEAEK